MAEQLDRKVVEFETFLNETLRGNLKKVLDQRDALYGEMASYDQLITTLKSIKEHKQLKTQVDLGCNFYVQAKIPDTSYVFIAVGFGFYVAMNHEEALSFIDKKISLIQRRCDTLTEQSVKIKAHIKLVLEGLRELQSIPVPDSNEERVVF
jgi:prefoldin alpha subunit